MSRFIRPALVAALLVVPFTTAQAQDWRGTPVFGQTRLQAGFTPDPQVIEMTAGGSIDAGTLAGGRCAGRIGYNPDYVLRYQAEDWPLYIRATSNDDTTLVIRDPSGSWQCNDDTNGLNPEVNFPRPESGTYHIWVGTYGENTSSARLEISELAQDGSSDHQETPDYMLDANFGSINLRQNFRDDPRTVSMVAGGSVSISSVNNSCPGLVSAAPDYEVSYDSDGSSPLTFSFSSNTDTVLLINAPDGEWYCDDDSDGNLDPAIRFGRARGGIYDVWVGTINGQMAQGTLSITELD